MIRDITDRTEHVLRELLDVMPLTDRHVLVIGVSTSEVRGHHIGTSGNSEVAQAIFTAVEKMRHRHGFRVAFQCCEHLNRALVVEEPTARAHELDEVTVVPVPQAGGSMASYAYRQWPDAIVVEHIHADAGIDIGDTLIGMHLRPVAVPVRTSISEIGSAHVTMARTRPKLIGGSRAAYVLDQPEK